MSTSPILLVPRRVAAGTFRRWLLETHRLVLRHPLLWIGLAGQLSALSLFAGDLGLFFNLLFLTLGFNLAVAIDHECGPGRVLLRFLQMRWKAFRAAVAVFGFALGAVLLGLLVVNFLVLLAGPYPGDQNLPLPTEIDVAEIEVNDLGLALLPALIFGSYWLAIGLYFVYPLTYLGCAYREGIDLSRAGYRLNSRELGKAALCLAAVWAGALFSGFGIGVLISGMYLSGLTYVAFLA